MEDLDAANGVLNEDPFTADLAVLVLLLWAQLLATRLLGGLLNRDSFGGIALEAGVLKQGAARRENVVLLIHASLVVFEIGRAHV